MRVVLLLVVFAIIGLTLAQWLGGGLASREPSNDARTSGYPTPPAVPSRPQDLKGFEQDMNRFMEDAATQRARQIESQEQAR